MWEDGVLAVDRLQLDRYQKVNRSQIPALAPIDLAISAACILSGETLRLEAIERFRAATAELN